MVLLLILYPFGSAVWWRASSPRSLGAKLGRPVTIGQGRGGLGRIVLRRLVVGAAADHKTAGADDAAPLFAADEISVPFSAAWGGSPVTIIGLRMNAVRGGETTT